MTLKASSNAITYKCSTKPPQLSQRNSNHDIEELSKETIHPVKNMTSFEISPLFKILAPFDIPLLCNIHHICKYGNSTWTQVVNILKSNAIIDRTSSECDIAMESGLLLQTYHAIHIRCESVLCVYLGCAYPLFTSMLNSNRSKEVIAVLVMYVD